MLDKLNSFFKDVLRNSEPHIWDEQALPSYTHSVSVVSYVFWKRVKLSLKQRPTGSQVLDYGCGVGALVPFLSAGYKNVIAYDIDQRTLLKCRELCNKLDIKNVEFIDSISRLNSIDDGSLDTIFALDVLEHIEKLDELVKFFHLKLKPNGCIIVSSPTENWIYKFMRKFGGKGYEGHFHFQAAKEVENALSEKFNIKLVNRIFPVLTFFRIIKGSKNNH